MTTLVSSCRHVWQCCPSFLRLVLAFAIVNILGDLLAFPFVHTFWNIVEFEGWFLDE